ncbi:MAG TPA: glyoxalase/bleomycin resistance/dioxygenase family protein, partial [Thomasclavelia ramosa]|nr:glyoxalase/bleomycin resistance/dioxygenase family protein [Thomasclavelia ramosa]
IKYVHPIKKYNSQQRVVRIFDPDNHMIEIGEAMDVVITNLLLAKKDIDEVSRITQYPIDYVRNIFNKL